MKRSSTKGALFTSFIALLLCCVMLLGTTFAWFTDEVTSTNNIIQSGSLDVEFEYSTDMSTWNKVEPTTNIFKKDALWEPGYAEVVYFKVSNVGDLALKYQLGVSVANEEAGTNKAGESFKLSDYIEYGVIEDVTEKYADRETAIAAVTEPIKLTQGLTNDRSLAATEQKLYALVVYMPEEVGNVANHKVGDDEYKPVINLGISVYATQLTKESDSFDDQYDKDAWTKVYDAKSLQDAINAGETEIVLTSDIELTESLVIPEAPISLMSIYSEPTVITLDLNGYTVNNNNGYVIENLGNIVITGNGTVSGLGGIRSKAGNITIENGNFFASSQWQNSTYQHTLKAENSNVVINGGNFDATVKGQTNAVLNASAGATITINGGNFKNVAGELTTFDPYLFTYENDGAVIINDGTFYGGWRFNGTESTTDIYGGDFTVGFDGQSFHANSTHVLTVYGGTFDKNSKLAGKIAESKPEGYVVVENADGTLTVLKGETVAGDNASLNDAIANGESEIALGKGDFSMPSTSGDVTISGTPDTVITIDKPTANKVALNGVTVVGSGDYTGIQHSDEVLYENCVVKGTQFLYANKVTFRNCTVDLTETASYIWTYDADNVEFIDCTFNTKGKAILIYHEGAEKVTNVSVTGCTFNATESALASGNVAAAIEIDSSLSKNGHYTLTTENNTVDADFSGEWRVKKSGTNNTTVNGVIYNMIDNRFYKGKDNTYYVYTADGLEKLNAMMSNKTAGRDTKVVLCANIDMTGKEWTPVDSHADTAFTFAELNGNGYTISNLTINGQAMFRRFAGSGDVVIKDVTFNNATVNSNGTINTSILTAQSYQNVTLDNVDVINSTISGGYKVAPLIATVYNESSSTITATLKNCDVTDTTVKATSYDFCTAGMVSFVYADDNDTIEFENCTVKNVKLIAPDDGYKAHAAIYTTDSEALYNEAEGVTVDNVTFEAL